MKNVKMGTQVVVSWILLAAAAMADESAQETTRYSWVPTPASGLTGPSVDETEEIAQGIRTRLAEARFAVETARGLAQAEALLRTAHLHATSKVELPQQSLLLAETTVALASLWRQLGRVEEARELTESILPTSAEEAVQGGRLMVADERVLALASHVRAEPTVSALRADLRPNDDQEGAELDDELRSFVEENFGAVTSGAYDFVFAALWEGNSSALEQMGSAAVPSLALLTMQGAPAEDEPFRVSPLMLLRTRDEAAALRVCQYWIDRGGVAFRRQVIGMIDAWGAEKGLRPQWAALLARALHDPLPVESGLSAFVELCRSLPPTEPMLAALSAALEQRPGLESAVVHALSQCEYHPSADALWAGFLGSADASTRTLAARALVHSPQASDLLPPLVDDPSDAVRYQLARFAIDHAFERGVHDTVVRLARDSSLNVRRTITGSESALPAAVLEALLGSSDPDTRSAVPRLVVQSVDALGQEEALRLLTRIVELRDPASTAELDETLIDALVDTPKPRRWLAPVVFQRLRPDQSPWRKGQQDDWARRAIYNALDSEPSGRNLVMRHALRTRWMTLFDISAKEYADQLEQGGVAEAAAELIDSLESEEIHCLLDWSDMSLDWAWPLLADRASISGSAARTALLESLATQSTPLLQRIHAARLLAPSGGADFEAAFRAFLRLPLWADADDGVLRDIEFSGEGGHAFVLSLLRDEEIPVSVRQRVANEYAPASLHHVREVALFAVERWIQEDFYAIENCVSTLLALPVGTFEPAVLTRICANEVAVAHSSSRLVRALVRHQPQGVEETLGQLVRRFAITEWTPTFSRPVQIESVRAILQLEGASARSRLVALLPFAYDQEVRSEMLSLVEVAKVMQEAQGDR